MEKSPWNALDSYLVSHLLPPDPVPETESTDPVIVGTRSLIALAGADPRLAGTVVRATGAKGHGGFALLLAQ